MAGPRGGGLHEDSDGDLDAPERELIHHQAGRDDPVRNVRHADAPATSRSSWPRLAALSINTMEVLVVGHLHGRPDELWGFLDVTRRGMRTSLVRRARLGARHPAAVLQPTAYEASGEDVGRLEFDGPEEMVRLLRDPRSPVTTAARELNLRLMRKGRTMQRRWHCPALADHLLAPDRPIVCHRRRVVGNCQETDFF